MIMSCSPRHLLSENEILIFKRSGLLLNISQKSSKKGRINIKAMAELYYHKDSILITNSLHRNYPNIQIQYRILNTVHQCVLHCKGNSSIQILRYNILCLHLYTMKSPIINNKLLIIIFIVYIITVEKF